MLTRFSAVFFEEIKQPLRLHKACASNLYFFFKVPHKNGCSKTLLLFLNSGLGDAMSGMRRVTYSV